MIYGQILGDLGADVILVEPPSVRIDSYSEEGAAANRSLYFWSLNRNKCGIKIDLDTDAGREKLLELVTSCDILVKSFAPAISIASASLMET